jgi:hypothetical protein
MDNAAHWLILAEDTRNLADRMHDPGAKRMLLTVALGYERLARHAARLTDTGLLLSGNDGETKPD